MKNVININGNNQSFPYLIEYINDDIKYEIDGSNTGHVKCDFDNNCIHLLINDNDDHLYKTCIRHKNDWYNNINYESDNSYIPKRVNISKLRLYIPQHNIRAYKRHVKYIINANTWINGYKIDLGSYVFKPSDLLANNFGPLKTGNNEYIENIEFEIIDPFYLTYSDKWESFRNNICDEPKNINNTGSILCVSLYSVDEVDSRYMIDSLYTGGITAFNISKDIDFLTLNLSYINNNDLLLNLTMNSEYNWLLSYLNETYNIYTQHGQIINNIKNGIFFEIVIKNKDTVYAIQPNIQYYANESYGSANQIMYFENLNSSINSFFNSWNNYDEGWNFVSSMIIFDDDEEIFSIISNELPITQEIFSRFVNGGSKKIIDINNMTLDEFKTYKTYNVVNKIENKIIQVDRPNESKSNIIQPVFFRAKDTELLTLHPDVTENICINLDDYKSKVERFILQIDNCNFNQIGANNYGVIFKVTGNKISKEISSGIYYILDENLELVTTGKFNCIR